MAKTGNWVSFKQTPAASQTEAPDIYSLIKELVKQIDDLNGEVFSLKGEVQFLHQSINGK